LNVVLGTAVTNDERTLVTRCIFRSFAAYLCEFFGYERFGPEFIAQHVTVKGLEHLNTALAQGRGAILCSAHYSNWELGAAVVAHLGHPISAIVQMHKSPSTNKLFVERRMRHGVRVVHSNQGALAALKALQRNETVAILGDRTTGGPEVRVTLFGKWINLPQGPWRLALSSGAALLPTFVHRNSAAGYELEFHAPLDIPCDGPRSQRMSCLAQAWAASLETRIKTDPTQWAVFHKVWNDAPASAPCDRRSHAIAACAVKSAACPGGTGR
jgi:lauroyl/myristoyl acyltransferase